MTTADHFHAYRTAAELPAAVSDFQALTVAGIRASGVPVKDIAAELEVSTKRVYQLLDQARDAAADSRRMLRVGAVTAAVGNLSQGLQGSSTK